MLASAALPLRVYRVSRIPVWEWPDWAFAGKDGTFGNRYDDPEVLYRVLYASASRYGCFLETLARFRPDLALYAELSEVAGEDDCVAPGVVPMAWLTERYIGSASAGGEYADVLASVSIAYLRTALASEVLALGLSDLDAAALHMTAPRSLTRLVSREVFRRRFDGIRYLSKYGSDIVNFAIFEGRVFLSNDADSRIEHGDEELAAALRVHDLVLETT